MVAYHNQQFAHARAELVEKSVIGPVTGGRRHSVRSVGCAVAAAGTRFVPCVDAGAHVLNDAAANLRTGSQNLEKREGRREVRGAQAKV